MFDSLNVEENIGFFLFENEHIPPLEVHSRVTDITKFFGLEESLDYYPTELSGGMKKRVATVRVVVTELPESPSTILNWCDKI